MRIVIPMSGRGARFQRAGYRNIKPLIEVDGRPMIAHVVDMFSSTDSFLFICAEDHLETTPLAQVLQELAPHGDVVAIEPHKLGPVEAVRRARQHISGDEPVVVNYCDFSVGWNYEHFKLRLEQTRPAGCLTAYRGFHPHSLGPNLYAYLRERDRYLVEIREKGCFTDDRMNEYASSGTYYFASGDLLLRTFDAAVERGLETHGEYYASTPYNLLVEQGLPVLIYALDYFLQWGTPEDLAEYQSWSDHFAYHADWQPRRSYSDTALLLPMAGEGLRFRDQGYTDPKPLIAVDGRPLVERSIDSLPPTGRTIALCRHEHLERQDLLPALAGSHRRDVEIVVVERLTEGQAATCLLAKDRLDLGAPLLIGCCDAAVVYDEAAYAAAIANAAVDGLIWTFRDHPHANRHPRQYGWVQTDDDGRVERISCKEPLSEQVQRDPGIIGIFWFREARFFVEAAEQQLAENRRVGGELYVDTTIEVALAQGRRVCIFDVDDLVGFGTPDDVRTYEYWASYFRSRPRRTTERRTTSERRATP